MNIGVIISIWDNMKTLNSDTVNTLDISDILYSLQPLTFWDIEHWNSLTIETFKIYFCLKELKYKNFYSNARCLCLLEITNRQGYH